MPADKTVNYVEFPAVDLAAVRKFYESNFGWKFTEYGDDYLAFNDGAFDGGFFRSESKSQTSSGSVLVVIYANDLEAVYAQLEDSGTKITLEITSFPGGRRFQFLDPNGNELAVWSDK